MRRQLVAVVQCALGKCHRQPFAIVIAVINRGRHGYHEPNPNYESSGKCAARGGIPCLDDLLCGLLQVGETPLLTKIKTSDFIRHACAPNNERGPWAWSLSLIDFDRRRNSAGFRTIL